MRITSVSAKNFASYKEIEIDFENQGLTLIQGPTGSGKSTLCDLIPWVLFGRTAKGGKVDEILSWGSHEPTEVTIYLDNPDIQSVTRIRTGKSGDLYFEGMNLDHCRGKDLNDTQKLINEKLGFDYDLYMSGAYFHEFSQTAQFFITTAKNRRVICEQIVDLALPKKLQLKTTERCKALEATLSSRLDCFRTLSSNIKLLERMQDAEQDKAKNWQYQYESRKKTIQFNYDAFERTKYTTIKAKICPTCHQQVGIQREDITPPINPYAMQLEALEREVNPHTDGVKDFTNEIKKAKREADETEMEVTKYQGEISDLETLLTVIEDFRVELIKTAIRDVQDMTNQFLTDYFDAEIRVAFSAGDADKLEVDIIKDGNECTYTQLSKGQRQILKLCFGVAIMKAVSNHHGVNFEQLFFDESLDGMDTNMKLKAFGLFQSLEPNHSSIFVVEHSTELKAEFTNSIEVELINGNSQICHR